MTRQHTESFNFMVEEGLSYAVQVQRNPLCSVYPMNLSLIEETICIVARLTTAICFIVQNLATYELKDPQNRKISLFIEVYPFINLSIINFIILMIIVIN